MGPGPARGYTPPTMRIAPTNPFHIARAYQVQAVRPAALAPENSQPVVGSIAPSASPAPSGRIIAAVVPGRVSFVGAEPAPAANALPFYRHPADANAAATSISAGRLIDVEG